MIYGRFGQPVTLLRLGTLDDVVRLDERRPDKTDKAAIKARSYVVVDSDGRERLYHLAYLRADGGSIEITRALDQIGGRR